MGEKPSAKRARKKKKNQERDRKRNRDKSGRDASVLDQQDDRDVLGVVARDSESGKGQSVHENTTPAIFIPKSDSASSSLALIVPSQKNNEQQLDDRISIGIDVSGAARIVPFLFVGGGFVVFVMGALQNALVISSLGFASAVIGIAGIGQGLLTPWAKKFMSKIFARITKG